MKKILSFLLALITIFISISPCFSIQEVHEKKDTPYGLFILIFMTIIWMIYLYNKEHHH